MLDKWLRLLCIIVALCLLGVPKISTSTTSTTLPSGTSGAEEDDTEGATARFIHQQRQKPNIVIIIADDMGWNDVSFHGSDQIPTPNIDALAYNGVILNNHYVPALCTPSRSALLTGKLPIQLGMQHSVILSAEPRGLPLTEKLLPEYLKDAGYKTHAIGKWHLGYYKKEYTPVYRGFDSHFGYWNGLQDYYSHFVRETTPEISSFMGFDMRRNLSAAWETEGRYSTDLFTEEAVRLINNHDRNEPMFLYLAHLAVHSGNPDQLLQAPDEEVAKFSYIVDPERRIYAAMVSKLDQSVGEVVTALRNRGMLENSIILFITDNGAPTSGFLSNHGSNYPLRGLKESPWEGGVRGVAAVWSPLIEKPKRVSNELYYVTDWLPTLFSAAGLDKSQLKNIDGKDIWQSLVADKNSPRSEVLINIDEIENYSAIRRGNFKYVLGMTAIGSSWEGASGRRRDEGEEGISPPYDPQMILRSKAGVAISGVITATQVMELKERRKRGAEGRKLFGNFKQKMLTTEEILTLRKRALVECNVKEEEKVSCDPLVAPCLFDLSTDPCEMVNLAEARPVILAMLESALLKYRMSMLPAANVAEDLRSNPALWNCTWTNWADPESILSINKRSELTDQKYSGPVVAVMAAILGLCIVGVMVLFALKYGKKSDSNDDMDSPKYEQQVSVSSGSVHSTMKDVAKSID